MSHRELIGRLNALDPFERKGREHFHQTGETLSYRSFLPAHAPVESGVLREADYFRSDEHLVLEKTLRYVSIPPHSHEFIEFAYVVAGSCTQRVNGSLVTQEAGDFSVIPPGAVHELIVPEESLCLTMKMRRDEFFRLQISNMALFVVPMLFPCGEDPFVKHSVLTLYEQQEDRKPFQEEVMNHLFVALMAYLMQNYRDSIRPLEAGNTLNVQMVQIHNYIFENFQTVTLRSLAKAFHYNEAYLSHLISKHTGKTFTENLRAYRMARAEQLLHADPGVKLAAVCEAVGYHDTVQFIRDFKAQYGMTPAKYKREKAQEKSSGNAS
jgi:AraC-like DNA-binding protein/mannose-6-phosphate isomerase-like protein (cupin superfamily)